MKSIDQHNLFSTPVWESYFDIDNDKLVNYALSLKNRPGASISNIGGYQSLKIDLSNDTFNVLGPLIEQINELLLTISEKYNLRKTAKVLELWININDTGDYNMSHVHPGAVLSGVYYIKTNGTGTLDILRSKEEAYLWQSIVNENQNKETWSGVSFIPKSGKVLVFPSWVDHAVAPCEGQRISLAFNAGF